jgi:prepilin-type N-terminal cleavage/methylation domain-containing protein
MKGSMSEKGFSLLELMIALGVAAIIATFAIPAYRTHVVKAHRLDAASALVRAVQFVETTRLAQTSESGEAITLGAGFDRAPPGGTAVYSVAVRRNRRLTAVTPSKPRLLRPAPCRTMHAAPSSSTRPDCAGITRPARPRRSMRYSPRPAGRREVEVGNQNTVGSTALVEVSGAAVFIC